MSLQIFVVGVARDERLDAGEVAAAIRSWCGPAGVPCAVVAVESEMTTPGTVTPPKETDRLGEPLTPCELRVLLTLARTGTPSTKALAATLGLSNKTVRNVLSIVYRKLGVTDRATAILRALQLGLVTVEREASA